jgi:UDP:flavonoid glycosyltransferase YjiC (YdhE family)
MARVLCAWELGSNLGHLGILTPLIRELKKRGHTLGLASQQLDKVHTLFDTRDVTLMQAPLAQGSPSPPEFLAYVEVIRPFGFTDPDRLTSLLSAWRQLYTWFKPDLVIVNSGAVSLLAAQSLGIKSATVGTGYAVPPRRNPMPIVSYGRPIPLDRMTTREAEVVSIINTALARFGDLRFSHFHELFKVTREIPLTYRETDHFGPRDTPYYGVLDKTLGDGAPEWPKVGERRVFAYLQGNSPHFRPFLAALKASNLRTILYASRMDPKMRPETFAPNIALAEKPVDIPSLAESCDLAVCHAGHGTTATCLLHGVPLLLLPNFQEQGLLSEIVQKNGLALLQPLANRVGLYQEGLAKALASEGLRANARAFRARYGAESFDDRLNRVLSVLDEALSS